MKDLIVEYGAMSASRQNIQREINMWRYSHNGTRRPENGIALLSVARH